MTTDPQRAPELELIREHRRRLSLSLASAGKAAGISDSYWKAIEDGTRAIKGHKGLRTLACMAHAVGVEPAEMEQAGRPDIAADLVIVRELVAADTERARADAERMVAAVPGLSERQRQALERLVTEDIREVRDNG